MKMRLGADFSCRAETLRILYKCRRETRRCHKTREVMAMGRAKHRLRENVAQQVELGVLQKGAKHEIDTVEV